MDGVIFMYGLISLIIVVGSAYFILQDRRASRDLEEVEETDR